MGEIAEMMLGGTLCCQCGGALDEEVIKQEIGIPIICDDCYKDLSVKEKEDYKHRKESDFLDSQPRQE